MMSTATKVLMVLTSQSTLGNTGEPTGCWLEEVTTPHYVFADAGADIDIVTIRGGRAPIDPRSIEAAGENGASVERYLKDETLQAALARTRAIDAIESARYDIVFIPGGHGTMWDLPNNAMLNRIIVETLERGDIVSAVCHGPAAFVTATSANGRPVIAGRRLTAFTNSEERAAGMMEKVPFLLESQLTSIGAKFECARDFEPFAVVDRNLITGQNPASSLRVAQLALEASRKDPLRTAISVEATPGVPRISTLMLLAAPENKALRDLLMVRPENPAQLSGKRIAVLTTDGVEEIELTATLKYFRERGADVEIISPPRPEYPERFGVQIPVIRETHILTVRYMEEGGWVAFDRKLGEVDPLQYSAAIVPGGAWNPDTLRADAKALAFLKALNELGRPVAALCHGPWVLADAGLLRGRKATAWWSMQKDIVGAGGTYVDEPVVVDGGVITSRAPIDLPQFLAAVTDCLTR
jgi:protease I